MSQVAVSAGTDPATPSAPPPAVRTDPPASAVPSAAPSAPPSAPRPAGHPAGSRPAWGARAGSAALAGPDEVRAFFEDLQGKVAGSPGLARTEAVQRTLADLVAVVSGAGAAKVPFLLEQARLASVLLLGETPKVDAAAAIVANLRAATGDRGFSWSASPAVRVFIGLGAFFYLVAAGGLLAPLMSDHLPPAVFGVDLHTIAAVMFAGALGSVTSMMIRINDFDSLVSADRIVPYLIGMFRPIIGISFALFLFSAVAAGIVQLDLGADKSVFFMLAVSFIAGFSERFAPDVIARVERSLGGVAAPAAPTSNPVAPNLGVPTNSA